MISYPPHIQTKPNTYIVELEDSASVLFYGLLESTYSKIPDTIIRHRYTKAFKGVSISTANESDLNKVISAPEVKRVWPVRFQSLPYSQSTQNFTFPYLHQKTGVAKAIEELGLTGKGVKIGIVDSGVDYNHPELGACWKTPGCPWQYGSDFIGDDYNPESESPVIKPDPDPMDCGGHGTHVAGIIGAQGPKVYGVAPGATLGMYRVFSCPVNGSITSSDEILLAGIEAAYKDGHDIISLSLGSLGWPESPVAVACSRLVSKGVVVVAANGNEGVAGLYTAGSPAVGRGVVAVGSVDNWDKTGSAAVITTPQKQKPVFISNTANDEIPFIFGSNMPVVAPIDSNNTSSGCSSFSMSLANKIALISRGNCSLIQKSLNAQNAGAAGVVIYNNDENVTPFAFGPSITIPVILISKADGQFILDGISQGKTTIRATKGEVITVPDTNGGSMSSFSSYGPSPELDLVPQISAPGGNIYSTYPLKLGKYASLSGTSMSAPYIAGALALLKQARPDLCSKQLRRALINTAVPITDRLNGRHVHPYSSGAGLVNIYNAIISRAIVDPPYLSLIDTNWGRLSNASGYTGDGPVRWSKHVIAITNTALSKRVHVTFHHAPTESFSSFSANGTFTPEPCVWPPSTGSVDKGTMSQVFSPDLSKINTVAPGQERRITVFIVAPSNLKESDKWYYGGFLNFTLQWDGESTKTSYVVPYAGFNGNYRKLDVLSVPSEGGPAVDLTHYGASANKTLSLKYLLSVPSRIVKATLIDSKNKTLGYVPYGYSSYAVRSQQAEENYASFVTINGTVYKDAGARQPVQVPSGQYHVRLSALRPFGRPEVSSDYQTWDSPAFSIA
ncbi:hypothetical protein GGI12_000619 [Dipsacomyces acuminosporus]|nr:hypothetical protein GGI12_000619 [Dipsacomyces acuminosporus]